jgi:hypothetical protein
MNLFFSYLSAVLLLCNTPIKTLIQTNKKCDLKGDWAEVSYLITPEGKLCALNTLNPNTATDSLQIYAANIHSIYYSGQGNLGIESGSSLKISSKKFTYKNHSLGRYHVSQNCSLITLPKMKKFHSPECFAQYQVVQRFENILMLQQGNAIVCYLRRDALNPYFVGE